jgi:WD40 repeat protein
LTLVRTDLETLTATSIQSVAGPPETGLSLWAAPDGTRAYVYFPSGPAIQRVNASGGGHSAELSGPGIRAGEGFVPSGGELVAMSPDGSRLYCLIPSGGIAVLQSESLALLNVLAPDQRFRSIGASSDGRQLYGLGFDGTYRVIDPTTGEIVFSRTGVRAADLLQVDMGE